MSNSRTLRDPKGRKYVRDLHPLSMRAASLRREEVAGRSKADDTADTEAGQ